MNATKAKPTIGSLFAGIGGFDIGFERAGFETKWQVEINDICREVLHDRFPHTQQFTDVRNCLPELTPVDVIVGGFPCQDVSAMGKRAGLHGERTGLFFNAMDIVAKLRPQWVVLENVCGLINSNDGKDLETVIKTLAQLRYVGFWRVLDSRYFGVPQKRRRIFLVAGLERLPPLEFMADTATMARISGKTEPNSRWADAQPTLLAGFATGNNIDLSGSNIVAVADSWDKMVERERKVENDGFLRQLAETDIHAARAAGNAVCPQVAEWVAKILIKTF